MTRDDALIMDVPAKVDPHPYASHAFDILLVPLSRPDLGEIRIGEDLFAIGRGEAPFAAYPTDATSVLSRRHARIFSEDGAVYVADLGSKNGTHVNGAVVAQQPAALRDGDELSFGAELSYRVKLYPRAPVQQTGLVACLTPMRQDVGLQPIVITGFPFLVSKADDTFARYRDAYPHQVNYLSRRHAHLYLKGGAPWIEDLGSTNGTFVNGARLGDHAVRVEAGDVLAFGGTHFVYRLDIARHEDGDATATRSITASRPHAVSAAVSPPGAPADVPPPIEEDLDKTTFVGAADSFLDIFCVDYAARQEDEVNLEPMPDASHAAQAGAHAAPARKPGRTALMCAEIARTLGLRDRAQANRAMKWTVAVVVALGLVGGGLYWRSAPDRSLERLMADREYARAAEVADEYLARHPSDPKYQAIGTEAMLDAYVPGWIDKLRAKDFVGAETTLAHMRGTSRHNTDARALIDELAWVGSVSRFAAERGGDDARIRLYRDEGDIRRLLAHWEQDAKAHQRALDRIANTVPVFAETYAGTLSALRKLQNDDAVYLGAIERLNASIATELGREQPEALQSMLAEYRDKYPRLAGLDATEADLKQYIALIQALRNRMVGPLAAQMVAVHFSTPPFRAAYDKLAAEKLPAASIAEHYLAATQGWARGEGEAAIGALGKIEAGPWTEELAQDIAHKRQVLDQYAALPRARGTAGYEDQLLALHAMLDPDGDAWYVRAIDGDVNAIREAALRRANLLLNRAATAWRQYRNNGLIGGEQRLEAGVSAKFRAQAKLLADAQADARQGLRIYAQLKADEISQWSKVRDDIQAEVDLQRRSLNDLRMVLDPAVLKAKLALVGEPSPTATVAASPGGRR
ncbi:FHA domain-containing protein [Cupriavidus plantarum]|uniref:FHA domain-containing protein n=1 Tax=Cupriavidus plantarum TaxID=942865 RepID=UPI000E276BBB|nr:FHA domain-containing protein [Cupriavidus plantarum]REE91751.1 FHA domain-containing protein [Cupriavidus plantarum]